jgi:signal peptidase II
MPAVRKKYLVFAVVALLSLAADQATKVWARASLQPRREPITIIDGFFDLTYSENPGAAFGLFRGFPGGRWLLLAVGIGAMFVVGSLLRKAPADKLRVAAELGLLAGGAVGNLYDRLVRGVVTDFVMWHYHQYHWPTFNVADAALVVGVLALLLDMKTIEPPKAETEEPAPSKKKKRR